MQRAAPAVLAGGLGLLFAVWTIDALRAILQATIVEMPVEIDARIDWRTLAFGALAALASAMVFGLAAWRRPFRRSGRASAPPSRTRPRFSARCAVCSGRKAGSSSPRCGCRSCSWRAPASSCAV